jgi:autotransporter-associated beta strand protein
LEVSGVISSTSDHIVVFRPNNDASPVILSGNNTYTGPTWIVGGVVSASNLGSVAGGPSNLGSPTSTANGTIRMSILNGTGTLRYTGTGETTNRVIDLFAANNGAFIDQSGTGLLKFTSDLTATGVGAKTLVLQGSTAGTGELAGAIVDNPTTGSTQLTTAFAAAATTITLNSVTGITVGASITGTGIDVGTTVTAINAGTRVVTLSLPTTGAGTAGDVINVTGVTNPTGLRKEGTGTWTVSGTNTFTGGVIINNGVLRITNSSGLGSGVKNIGINASANKLLELDGSGGDITLPADFTFYTSGVNGVIRNTAGDNVINSPFIMQIGNGNTKIISDNAGSLTLNGDIAANTTTRVLDLGGDSVANNAFNGVLSNASSPGLAKTGTGTWTLNGVNLYTGLTDVTGGTLVIGSTGSIDASTSLTVAAGAELDTTAKSTHTLPATVTIGLDGDTDTSGLIDATGQALDIDGATVTFNVTGTLDAPVYVLANYGSISGASNFASATAPAGYELDYTHNGGTQIALVQLAGSAFDTWIDSYFPGETDPAIIGKDADPDGDGANNLLEFALKGIPNDGSNNGLYASLVQDASAPAGKELTLVAAVRDGATFANSGTPVVQTATVDGVVYSIQGTLDLVTLPGSAVSHASGPADTAPVATGLPDLTGTDWEYHTFKLDASEGLGGKGFLRAKVEAAP